MKSGKAGKGTSHAAYIGGGEKYAERKDVIGLLDRNLPSWAKDGVEFFAAADKFERANGRTYTEIEAAIPRSVADPVAYAAEYAEKILGKNHPYRLAVHDKPAADGGRNIHMHLMFSDRKLDGIERDREQFFKRAAAPYRHRVTKEMMPADPAKSGAGKDRKWNERDQVQVVRDSWQQHAKAHGIDLDLRSNAAKGLGVPEPKLGPEHPRASANPARQARKAEMERLRAVRVLKAELHEINHQEQQHARAKQDQARHHQPATDHTQMRDVFGIDNLHDLGRSQDLLQQNAPDHLRPSQAAADPARLHQLAATRAAVVAATAAAEAERQAAQQARADAESRRKVAWTERGARCRSGPPNRVMRLDQAKTQDGRTLYRWGGNGPSAGKVAVIQNGNRLAAAGKYSQPKAKAMAYIVKQNGWQSVTITGDAAFKAMALAELLAQGIAVQNPELQPQIEALQARAEQQRQVKAEAKEQAKADAEAKAEARAKALAEAKAERQRQDAMLAKAARPLEEKLAEITAQLAASPLTPEQRARAAAYVQEIADRERAKESASQPAPIQAPTPAPAKTDRLSAAERALMQRMDAAIQSGDKAEIKACYRKLDDVEDKAKRATWENQPTPFLDDRRAEAIQRETQNRIQSEMNGEARARGETITPWAEIGARIDSAYDHHAKTAAENLATHRRTQRPEGFFKKAEGRQWDAQLQAHETRHTGWDSVVKRRNAVYAERLVIAEPDNATQLERERSAHSAKTAQESPAHTRALDRYECIRQERERQHAALERAFGKGYERELTPSRGMGR